MTLVADPPRARARSAAGRDGPTAPPPSLRARMGRRHLPVHWPLTALLLGYPLWWLLGVAWIAPTAAGAVMAVQLLRRRTVRVPPMFGLWLLFVLWVLLGVTMLWVDAPLAVPGGGGPGRVAVFGLRMGEYAAITVALLWVGTLTEAELPRRWVRTCLSWLFVTTVVGGLAGVLVPDVDFPSLLELVLPGSLTGNGFVSSLVHPGLADVQTVLGYEEARPKAPFDFTNTWGANFSVLLPFFVVAWLRDGSRWQRVLGPVVLLAGAVPVIFSLNRALWATLALLAVVLVVVLARHGRRLPLLLASTALVGVVATLLLSPLGAVLGERLENPHSNDRRGQLLSQTVSSAAQGSPVLGFGTTREVQGSYSSIAGGETADCSACAVPPLGTQGQIWLVVFSQGLVGAVLFLGWLAVLGSWCWRAATTSQMLLLFPLLALVAQLPVYDTLGMPVLTVVVAAGLVWRERAAAGVGAGTTARALARRLREDARLLAACSLVGLLAGGLVAAADRAPTYAARAAVLLVPAPVALSTDLLGATAGTTTQSTSEQAALRATIDTEAALAVSDETLSRLTDGSPAETAGLRSRIRVTAPPNTQVLVLEVRASTAAAAEQQVADLRNSYLRTRRAYLRERQAQAVAEVQAELRSFDAADRADAQEPGAAALLDEESARQLQVESALREALGRLQSTNVRAGQTLRTDPATQVRAGHEVPVVSGLALGLLAGVGLAGLRRASRRRA